MGDLFQFFGLEKAFFLEVVRKRHYNLIVFFDG
jgi:hypothetical protein